jgi:hypothetical protein
MDEPPYTCETSEIMNKLDMGEIPETPAKEQGYDPLDAAACSPLALLKTLANISLHRSSQGVIRLELRLSQVGLVDLELTQEGFVRLMFGEAAVQAEVTRHIQKRRPVHSENDSSAGTAPEGDAGQHSRP